MLVVARQGISDGVSRRRLMVSVSCSPSSRLAAASGYSCLSHAVLVRETGRPPFSGSWSAACMTAWVCAFTLGSVIDPALSHTLKPPPFRRWSVHNPYIADFSRRMYKSILKTMS